MGNEKTLIRALAPLVAIADAYDANGLDDSARKQWGANLEKENTTPPDQIQLYHGRGGRELLTLAHCFSAREIVNAVSRMQTMQTPVGSRLDADIEIAKDVEPVNSGSFSEPKLTPLPIPIILYCPMCHARHIDEGEFAKKHHHTHSCQSCGHTWRPAKVATIGVQFLPGFKST